MSSPIAKKNKNILDKILISFHKKASHSKRVELLSTFFAGIIKSFNKDNRQLRFLDIGCGDMSITRSLATKYDKIEFACIDIYPNSENWDNYFEFDGKKIPFHDNSFDISLLSDVLHHDQKNMEALLREAKRVSPVIILKDHFEHGFWSRKILQLADFLGNYGYGVSIPERYLSKHSYYCLLEKCGLQESHLYYPVELYPNIFKRLIMKSKYHFVSVLTSSQ
jgi:SAM-dependent methyltransferase